VTGGGLAAGHYWGLRPQPPAGGERSGPNDVMHTVCPMDVLRCATMSLMTHTDRRRGFRGEPLQVLNVRVPRAHRAYLALRAELDDVAISEVMRRLIDQAIDAEPEVLQDVGDAIPDSEQAQRGMTMPLRTLLGVMDPDQAPELAARLRDVDPGPDHLPTPQDLPF